MTGIPWWGAVATAVFASAIGFAFDAASGGGQLTAAFATLYVLGCLIAVLAVRQSDLFTAVIQPPLVLFIAVPGAYFVMHSSDIQGLKDLLINCGYPLIERFPLMFFTSAAVLLIGLARWYFGRATRPESPQHTGTGARAGRLATLLGRATASATATPDASPEDEDAPRARRRTRAAAKPASTRSSRSERPGRRAPSRQSRAAETEIIDAVADDDRPRPRRTRAEAGEARPRARETGSARASRGARETREPREPRPRRATREPREPRREARESRETRQPREARQPRERRPRYSDDRYSDDRYSDDRYADDRYNRSVDADDRRQPRERPQRRSRSEDYEPYEPYGGSGSHHPVSRVRYRGEDSDDGAGPPAEPTRRPTRRSSRDVDADRWKFDI